MFDFNAAIDKYKGLIIDTQNYIWANPETGYKEFKTSKYLEDVFVSLGYEIHKAEGITGFYTVVDTGREGPELLILSELDSLICAEHPDCDKETGAVHCCGHSAQCAALVGIAAALKEEGALEGLSGRIRLCAVPAEELIEIEYRNELKSKGIIKYMGGKPEFLRRGYFDGVDLAFMVHTTSADNYMINIGNVGCVAKKVIYKGKSAHAGGAHGADYYIADPERASVGSAKWQLEMLRMLLSNGAAKAKKIVAEFKPQFASKEEYFKYIDEFMTEGDRIVYSDGKAEIRL